MVILCCQVEVAALGLSLVQRSPRECSVSECDREASVMKRPWPEIESKRHRKPREKCSSNLGSWEPSQHLLEDRGKSRKCVSKWVVTGPSICKLISSQQSGEKTMHKLVSFDKCVFALLIILIYVLFTF